MAILYSRKLLIPTLVIAVAYVILAIYLINGTLVRETLFNDSPFLYKIKLLFALLEGMWTAMTHVGLFTLILTGILTGANLSLLAIKLQSLGGIQNTHLVVGGSSILGIVGSGCAACGLPIISFLGLSSSIAFLPFRGAEFSYIALMLLVFSLYTLLRSNKKASVACNIPRRLSNTTLKKARSIKIVI